VLIYNGFRDIQFSKFHVLTTPLKILRSLFHINYKGYTTVLGDASRLDPLALEAILQRRCPLIILSDCTYDPDYRLNDFAAFVRSATIDYGIVVEQIEWPKSGPLGFDNATGRCMRHFFMARLKYPGDNESTRKSLLVVLKPALTGDEPFEVSNLAANLDRFPHAEALRPDESFLDGYRQLGIHTVASLFDGFERVDVTNSSEYRIQRLIDWLIDEKNKMPEFSSVSSQFERTVQSTVEHILHGPTLDAYSGYICASFDRELTLWFQPMRPDLAWSEKFDISGKDVPSVEFEVQITAENGKITPMTATFVVHVNSPTVVRHFYFSTTPKEDNATLWIEVFQKNRRVLSVPLDLEKIEGYFRFPKESTS
jgi:hypothetical protein